MVEAFRGEMRQKTSDSLFIEKIRTGFAAEVTKTPLTAGLLRAISATLISKSLSNPVPRIRASDSDGTSVCFPCLHF